MSLAPAHVTEKEKTCDVHAEVSPFAHYDFMWFRERRGTVIVLVFAETGKEEEEAIRVLDSHTSSAERTSRTSGTLGNFLQV